MLKLTPFRNYLNIEVFMRSRPRIGITTRLELETRRFYLGRDYSEAIFAAGGLPVHLPLIDRSEYISEVLSELDGLLLPGSDTDPDPVRYGEDPHPRLKKVIPEKDQTDLLALEAAELSGIPVLGICFGMQILNVARGGSLVQDIGSQIDGSLKHDQGLPLERNSHRIRISESGLLRTIAGADRTEVPFSVNSHHHQSVRNVGRELRPVAWAGDGVIEAIEDVRDGRFVLGVQWHPELSWETDPLSAAIFSEFVKRCSTDQQ